MFVGPSPNRPQHYCGESKDQQFSGNPNMMLIDHHPDDKPQPNDKKRVS
jgi:hypothetical protein